MNEDTARGCGAVLVFFTFGLVAAWLFEPVAEVLWWLATVVAVLLVSALILAGTFAVLMLLLRATHVLVRTVYQVMLDDAAGWPRANDTASHLGYVGGVAWVDLREIVRRCRRAISRAGVVVQIVLLAAFAGMLAVTVGAGWVLAGVLRGLDRALRLLRRVRMVCPQCFEWVPYPAYLCPECHRIHHDIRPGTRGILRRLCLCGARLPTLLLFGTARRLAAICPHCTASLDHRPGEVRELVVPLFGGTGAGKSRLALGVYSVLTYAARAGDVHLTHGDEATAAQLRASPELLRPHRRLNPTLPGRATRGLLLSYTVGRCTRLLQLYDTAGEHFDRVAAAEELTYLGKAETFLLVLDPLAPGAAWSSLNETDQHQLSGFRSQTRDPMLAYQQTYEQVERQYAARGRSLRRARLAIVFSRNDLIAGTALDPGGRDPTEWAEHQLGLGNLLRSARGAFRETRVFVAATVVHPEGRPDPSLVELVRWIMDGEPRQLRRSLSAPHLPTKTMTSNTAEKSTT